MRELKELRRLQSDRSRFQLRDFWPVFEHQAKEDQNYKVSFLAFHSDADVHDLMEKRLPPGFSVQAEPHADFVAYKVRRTIEREDIEGGKRTVAGECGIFRSSESDIWYAFSSDGPDFFSTALVRLIEGLRPWVARAFFSSDELRSLLESIEEKTKARITVQKAVLYSHQEEGEIDFKKQPYPQLFNIAEEQDMYVDKVDYVLERDGELELHAYASREGVAHFYQGKAKVFRDVFLGLLSKAASHKAKLFERRAKPKKGELAQPVLISYGKDVFKGVNDNLRLVRALANLDRSGIAVLHRNPYLHVSMIDFVDGSTFDVFSSGSKEISIIPSAGCSVNAFSRLTEQIFKDFHEGEIKTFTAGEYSLADFVAAG